MSEEEAAAEMANPVKAAGPTMKGEMNEGAKTNFHIPESNASDVAPSEGSSYRGKL